MKEVTLKDRLLGYAILIAQILLIAGLVNLAREGHGKGISLGVGYLTMVAGTMIAVYSGMAMGRMFWPSPTPRDNGHLVTEGPFGIVRNPFYAGLIIFGFGAVLKSGTVVGFYTLGALAVALMWKISIEERLLKKRYPEFSTYQNSTPSLVPRIRKTR